MSKNKLKIIITVIVFLSVLVEVVNAQTSNSDFHTTNPKSREIIFKPLRADQLINYNRISGTNKNRKDMV